MNHVNCKWIDLFFLNIIWNWLKQYQINYLIINLIPQLIVTIQLVSLWYFNILWNQSIIVFIIYHNILSIMYLSEFLEYDWFEIIKARCCELSWSYRVANKCQPRSRRATHSRSSWSNHAVKGKDFTYIANASAILISHDLCNLIEDDAGPIPVNALHSFRSHLFMVIQQNLDYKKPIQTTRYWCYFFVA